MDWNETINKIDELDNKLLIPKEGNLEKANLKETFKTMTDDDFETFYEVLKERDKQKNIINKFEEWLYGEKMTFYRGYNDESYLIAFGDVYSKWKELKRELNEKG